MDHALEYTKGLLITNNLPCTMEAEHCLQVLLKKKDQARFKY